MSVVSWCTQDHGLLSSVWRPVFILCCQKLVASVFLEAHYLCRISCPGSILAITQSYRQRGWDKLSSCSSGEVWACSSPILWEANSALTWEIITKSLSFILPYTDEERCWSSSRWGLPQEVTLPGRTVWERVFVSTRKSPFFPRLIFLILEEGGTLTSHRLSSGFSYPRHIPASWTPTRMAFL